MKKLIPALALLVVSAVLMGTSTFAWFSLNNKVTVTGMQVTTKVGDSLQVAADSLDSVAKVAEANFSNGLNQDVKGFLAPVSTVNGTTFFYNSTGNTKANGDAIANTYLDYATTGAAAASNTTLYGNAFSENYDITKANVNAFTSSEGPAVGYVDYVVQLKATNTAGADGNLVMSKCNLLYNYAAAAGNNIKAYRVAMFVENITDDDPAGGVGALTTILRQSGAQYFGAAGDNAVEAVSSTSALAAVDTKIDDAATLFAFTENGTKYFKVVVRMWLEGEDTTCNNETYMALNGTWTLDLMFEIVSDANVATKSVINIGTVANVTATGAETDTAGLSLDTYLNAATTVKTYQWFNADTGLAAAGTNNAATYEAEATGNFYCIVTAYGSQYRSNTVHLVVTP